MSMVSGGKFDGALALNSEVSHQVSHNYIEQVTIALVREYLYKKVSQ